MNTLNQTKPHWQIKQLIGLHVLVGILLVSFFWSPTRSLWLAIDEVTFFYLNGWIESNTTSQWFWAIMNVRVVDVFVGLLMFTPFCLRGWIFENGQRLPRFIQFLSLLLIYLVLQDLIENIPQFDRISPSVTLSPAHLLTEILPQIPAKDSSHHSYPGDHASILILWGYFIIANSNRNYKWLVIPFVVMFTLPRLVGGAHWLSDVTNGSLMQVLIVIAWCQYSPLGQLIYKLLNTPLNWVKNKISRTT